MGTVSTQVVAQARAKDGALRGELKDFGVGWLDVPQIMPTEQAVTEAVQRGGER
jgi:hypothetical protein